MKKQLLLFALQLLPMVASAYEGETVIDGINYYINTDDQTAEVRLKYDYSGEVVIPETVEYKGVTCNVTSIGDGAFNYCTILTSVIIPNSVTSIGNEAFIECTSLTSITIGNSVTSIGNYAFSGCSSLTSVTIGNSVTSIGNYAFSGCSSLTSVTIPNSVTSIGNQAFLECSSLTSIAIPNSVTSIGNSAFYGCPSLTSITIPNSVTSIGNYAFFGCSITFITIPNSVTNIGDGAFSKCISLTSIIVESGNSVYDSRNNCNAIIRTADNVLIAGCQNTIIPNSVTSIGNSAFYGCPSLTSITIPNSVTSIGARAFDGCSSLTSVTIPNSVTSIGQYAFIICTGLTSITIGNSVTSIGDYAFSLCTGLTYYCFAEAVPSTKTSAFHDSNIKSATLHVPESSVSEYANTYPWSQFGSIVGMGKCATPTIAYANGKVHFACETEDVEFISTVTCSPTKLQNGSELEIGSTFTISVYATKEGYIDSDVAMKTINMSQVGDIDADGQITVSDITSLVNLLLGK